MLELPIVPDYIMTLLSILSFSVCVYSFVRCKEVPAVGYLLPSLYFIVFYTVLDISFPQGSILNTQQSIARLGLAMFFVDVIVWRIVHIRLYYKSKGEKWTTPL